VSKLFPHLFKPLTLNHKTLKHRLNFGAHTANMAEAGLPGERHLGYYTERARGGAAMIVVEPVPIHRTAVLTRGNFLHSDDSIIPHFRRITDACHEYDTVMIQQLYHVGQHGDFDNSYEPSWSPSGLPSYHDSDGSHAMSDAEIEELIEAFVAAARRAQAAGFDGIEIMAAYNALFEQFWSPWSNRRDDRWGGELENRVRFSADVLGGIRQACGLDFIIGVCVSVHPPVEVLLSLEQMLEVVLWHDERTLADYWTCGSGSYLDFYPLMPTFMYGEKLTADFTETFKREVSHAKIQSESHIRTPENANTIIGAGQADMVSIVRGQIADPHMAAKAMQDRPEDVRPCISCNQMCWGRRSRDYWISCLVNPSAGREFEWGGDRFEPATEPRHVLVVGGGPGGLETARVAAERGHRVTLVEASPHLGGQFRLAGMQPRRAQILDLIDWYERQLSERQVEVRLNTPVDEEEIKAIGADVVVAATGSLPSETGFQRFRPQADVLPGIELGRVWSVEDVMSRTARCGERVVVIDDGGNWRGGGTAWHLAEQGHHVILITPASHIAHELVRSNADYPLRSNLTKLGAELITDTVISAWLGDAATLVNLLDGSESRIECDDLVLATPNVSETTLHDALQEDDTAFESVGDCVSPRWAVHAIYEGRKLGRML